MKKTATTKKSSAGAQKKPALVAKTELRSPIVAVMGHVDHGKTSLLDAIRGTSVQAGEAGGITQNTRAHRVELESGEPKAITFIDTPGHEAFTNMRARGAKIADIAVLVVAADDGVQPQTKESIKFINEAKLPVIVACNKIDLPAANPAKIKQELSQNDLLVEEFGGDALFVEVSAIKGTGIPELLETIQLVTEVHGMHARKPAQGVAEGFVLESNLDKEIGPVALVILKAGEIQAGDYVFADDKTHKIRATLNEAQQRVGKAQNGQPTWLIGLEGVLDVGQNLLFFNNPEEPKKLEKEAAANANAASQSLQSEFSDSDIFAQLLNSKEDREDKQTKLKVIVVTDTKGTLEAVTDKLNDISNDEAKVEVFSAKTGTITESDVEMARDVKAIVLGFQVKIDPQAETLAKNERILVRNYEIIYNLIQEVEAVMESMREPTEEIVEVARAKVKKVFQLSDGKWVCGCEVISGNVIKGYKAFLERKGEEIGEGKISSLKYLKNEIKEAKKGTECGIMFDKQDFEPMEGDFVVCFKVEK